MNAFQLQDERFLFHDGKQVLLQVRYLYHRESTERPEYIEAGASILSGLDPKNILESTNLIMSHNSDWDWDVSLGDGKTASKVVNILRGKSRKILEL